MVKKNRKQHRTLGTVDEYILTDNQWRDFLVSDQQTGVVIKVGCRKISLTYEEANTIANDIIELCSKKLPKEKNSSRE